MVITRLHLSMKASQNDIVLGTITSPEYLWFSRLQILCYIQLLFIKRNISYKEPNEQIQIYILLYYCALLV